MIVFPRHVIVFSQPSLAAGENDAHDCDSGQNPAESLTRFIGGIEVHLTIVIFLTCVTHPTGFVASRASSRQKYTPLATGFPPAEGKVKGVHPHRWRIPGRLLKEQLAQYRYAGFKSQFCPGQTVASGRGVGYFAPIKGLNDDRFAGTLRRIRMA